MRIYHIWFCRKRASFPQEMTPQHQVGYTTTFFRHSRSYLLLCESSASWNTPAALWLGLTLPSSTMNFLSTSAAELHWPYSKTHKRSCCNIDNIEYAKKKEKKGWLGEKRLNQVSFFSSVRVGELCSSVSALGVVPHPSSRGRHWVLTAPVMLWPLAVTCGSMWGCRSTQQEGDLLCSQLIRPQLIVLWRVGEAVCPPPHPHNHHHHVLFMFNGSLVSSFFLYLQGQTHITAD